MVGREQELSDLTSALSDVLKGQGGVCALIGEAGLGKSRLLEELRQDRRMHSVGVLEDWLVSFEATAPYELIRRRICAGLELADTASAEAIRASIAARLAALDARERERAVRTIELLFAAGRRNAEGVRAQGPAPPNEVEFRHELVEIVELLWRAWVADGGAGVYVVDDFHHADMASVQIFEALLPRVGDLPFLVVLALRPEEHGAAWMLHRALSEQLGNRYRTIRLRPLDDEQAGSLVDALLMGARVPEAFRADLLDRVDGNPLFAEEIVRSLISQGLVVQRHAVRGTSLRLAEGVDLRHVMIPTTLQALMQERMDRLKPAEKQTLQLAAVFGRTFTQAELAAAVEDAASVESHLEALQRAMLLRVNASGSMGIYSFNHALTQEAAYQTILNRQRRRLHGRIGGTLERLHEGQLEEHAGLLGFHFARARDARAVQYAAMASERAFSLYAYDEAVEHASRAIDVALQLKQTPPAGVYQVRGRSFLRRGSYAAARADFGAALELVRPADDAVAEWSILLELGESWEGNDYAQAGEWYEAALVHAQTIGDELLVARTLCRLGNWHTNVERIEEARAALQLALGFFQSRNDRRGVAEALDLLGTLEDIAGDAVLMLDYFRQAAVIFEELDERRLLSSALASLAQAAGRPAFDTVVFARDMTVAESFEAVERAITIARSIQNRPGEAYASLTLGAMYDVRGQFDLAMAHNADGLAIAQEVGHNEWLAMAYCARGWLHTSLLEADVALPEFERGLQYARAVGSSHFINTALGCFVLAAVEAGDLARAASMLQAASDDMSEHTVGGRTVWLGRANFEIARGNPEAALRINDTLFDTALNLDDTSDSPRLAWQRGEALRSLGRLDDARDALNAALRGAGSRAFRSYLWRLHAVLGRILLLRGELDDAEQAFAAARAEAQLLSTSVSDLQARERFVGRTEELISDARTSADVTTHWASISVAWRASSFGESAR